MVVEQRKFELIYNQHKDHIYNYIYRMCNDPHLAMDVVQQTFLKVLSKPEILEVEHLKAYLFTIARNKLHDEWKQKTPESLEGDDGMAQEIDNGVANEAQLDVERQASKTAIVNAIKLLPNNLRELMLLRYTEDLSIAEIADITKRTISDIKVSLHRARFKFEEKLTAQMYSKVAVARDHCKILTDMLLPFGGRNIPEQQLGLISKHIMKCELCIKDTADMKKSRQLFTALPLLPFPLGFDEFLKLLPPAATSTLDAKEIASPASNDSSAIVSATEKSISAKVVVASVATVAIVGSLGLFLSSVGTNSSVAPLTQQTSSQTPESIKKIAENKNTGIIKLNGQFGTGKTISALSANIEWDIYSATGSKKNLLTKVSDSKKGGDVSFNLMPGKYVAVGRLGEVQQKTEFKITKQQTKQKALVFNAGLLDIKIDTAGNKNIDANNIRWSIKGSKNVSYKGNKAYYLPPGQYRVIARYADNLEKSMMLKVLNGKKTALEKLSFEYSKVTLDARLTGKSTQHELLRGEELQWTILQKQAQSYKNISHTTLPEGPYLLAPGEYKVDVKLGQTVSDSRDITVGSGQSEQRINFKLNAGRLALVAKLKNNNPILASAMTWTISNGAGKAAKPVYTSQSANPKLYLPSGSYQVIAKAGMNASITRIVKVIAGQTQSPKAFSFDLGAVKLRAKSELEQVLIGKNIQWLLEQYVEGKAYSKLPISTQPQPTMVLKPGRYRVNAVYADRFKQSGEFTVKAGVVTEFSLLINDDSRPKAWR